MSLIPLDTSNQVGIYSNNTTENKIGTISKVFTSSFAPRQECPLDPKNDLLPPAFVSPLSDMKLGPPEQNMKRYFSLSVNDINTFHKEKIKKWIKVYEKVLGHCYRKVREHVLRDQQFCFFPVPEYLAGFPLFNITHCTFFLIKKLNQGGFQTKFIPPNVIYIHWAVKNHYKNYVKQENILEQKVISQQNQKVISQQNQKVISQQENNVKNVTYNVNNQDNKYLYPMPLNQNNQQNQVKQVYGFQQEDQFLF
jgi:hypothetical protein